MNLSKLKVQFLPNQVCQQRFVSSTVIMEVLLYHLQLILDVQPTNFKSITYFIEKISILHKQLINADINLKKILLPKTTCCAQTVENSHNFFNVFYTLYKSLPGSSYCHNMAISFLQIISSLHNWFMGKCNSHNQFCFLNTILDSV